MSPRPVWHLDIHLHIVTLVHHQYRCQHQTTRCLGACAARCCSKFNSCMGLATWGPGDCLGFSITADLALWTCSETRCLAASAYPLRHCASHIVAIVFVCLATVWSKCANFLSRSWRRSATDIMSISSGLYRGGRSNGLISSIMINLDQGFDYVISVPYVGSSGRHVTVPNSCPGHIGTFRWQNITGSNYLIWMVKIRDDFLYRLSTAWHSLHIGHPRSRPELKYPTHTTVGGIVRRT